MIYTNDQRNERVREFLHGLYGSEPQPLRCYLHQSEAQELTRKHLAGRSVFSDMDITGYAGRHRQAVEDSIRSELDPKTWEFWHKARLAFLELGGCYAEGQQPPLP